MIKLIYNQPKFKCPHCSKMIGRAQKKNHFRSLRKIGDKWVCVGRPEHPNHKQNEAHKKSMGATAWN